MQHWQQQLAQSVHSIDELLELVGLNRDQLALDERACDAFSLRVPKPFVSRIQHGEPQDPLLRQVLPLSDELLVSNAYSNDPLNEKQANKTSGLLHKYFGRVLLILTSACAVNCRYCFRRHFPYQDNLINESKLQAIVQYIRNNPEIYEVILSGGDPLILKDSTLAELMQRLEKLPQLNYLRIHTRLPVMIPSRITDELIHLLRSSRLKATFVIHCNHAQEIDQTLGDALLKLRDSGIIVLNQSVLLKGVNDDVATLVSLSHRLYEHGVLPYYLHMLDAVQGASHFFVEELRARQLMTEVQAMLPGFLMPRLVREIAGASGKTLLSLV